MLSTYLKILYVMMMTYASSGNAGHHNHAHHASINNTTSETQIEKIDWVPGLKLSWGDFKGKPDSRMEEIAALTSSSISYSRYCENGVLKADVKAIFRKQESWVRTVAMTDEYLAHEQLHFDITELYARKLRASLSYHRFSCDQVQDMENVVKRILDEWRKMEEAYDLDTAFSHDKPKQRHWHAFINNQLNDYHRFIVFN